ncbi:MAG: peptide deformylase [Planctomycetota bacterium]
MQVLVYPDPLLRHPGKPITRFDGALRDLAGAMLAAMYEEGGVGLAASQVGIEQRLLVLNPTGDQKQAAGELVLCNPRLTKKKGREYGEEGCLSFPEIRAEVERWVDITVTFQDLDGKEQTLAVDGWLARIIQHEIDHLDGVFFVDRLSAAEKLRVKSDLQELERKYVAKA